MTTTFMHYRKFDRRGQIMAKGGLTLAIQQDGQQLTIAMAECGRKDNFNRSLGRIIAEGRLKARSAKHLVQLELPAETMAKSFIHNQQFVRDRVKKLLAGGK
jgi:hypothetical protein